jgi:protein-arginine kinase activator protein McsA
VSNPLCEHCGEQTASVFITKIINNSASTHRYCENCARELALGEGWLAQLAAQLDDESDLPEDVKEQLHEALNELPLDDIVKSLLDGAEIESNFEDTDDFGDGFDFGDDAFGDPDFSDDESMHEATEMDDILPALSASIRCPNCGTTWDRLKQDGRAGCAGCYNAFRQQLTDVMNRFQRGPQHVGKSPRAAEKRRRRLEHLRQRRDNQLSMLQNRLREAVAAERYEEAAKIRDKIKIVSSTIVGND